MEAQIKWLREQDAVLRGARNPHVQARTFRFLRTGLIKAVRLASHPSRSLALSFHGV
jgi:hypothetical protein